MALRLDVKQLVKVFGPRRVLDGADLSIAPYETTVLMGTSGSGKTVLAKCILGLIKPDNGTIVLDDLEITHLTVTRRAALLLKFGVLFQRGALFDSLPVWRNVAFGLMEGRGIKRVDAKDQALEILARLGLDAVTAELLPAELSGGMQKRVALARAIAGHPEFLILDEPTEGLDPIMTAVVAKLIVEICQGMRVTTLAITNNIECARKIATRAAVLRDGKIVWHGDVDDIGNSGDSYVDLFA